MAISGNNWKSRLFTPLLVVLLLLLSAAFYHQHIHRFPSHIHAWTQSDRLALAHGFIENGFNFFKPSTYNLRPEFEPAVPLDVEEGITSVDFPIVEYLAALLMKLTSHPEPVVFRMLVLLIGLCGLVCFSLLFREMGLGNPLRLLMVLFIFSAPVYTYFQAGFIPSITAIAATAVGLLYYQRFLNSGNQRFFAFSIVWLTLAALVRMPFVMPLGAVVLVEFFDRYKKGRLNRNFWFAIGISGLVFGGYFSYNQYLSYVYGSLFLNKLMPPDSLAEMLGLIKASWQQWGLHYFTVWHYGLTLISLLFLTIQIALKKVHVSKMQQVVFVLFIFGIIYTILMISQFVAHDYYFLDSLFLPVVLLTGLGLAQIAPALKRNNLLVWSASIVLVFLMLRSDYLVQNLRYTTHSWDRIELSRHFESSRNMLEQAGVPADASILVIDAQTYNIPLLLMGRKGYTVVRTRRNLIEVALGYNFDYIAMQNRFVASGALHVMPELRNRLKPVANNGKIGVYTYDVLGERPQSFAELLMVDNHTVVREDLPFGTDTLGLSLLNRQFLPVSEFSVTADEMNANAIVFQAFGVSVSAVDNGLFLVVDISRDAYQHFYDNYPMHSFFRDGRQQASLDVFLNLPEDLKPGDRIKCYVWNPANNDVTLHQIKSQYVNYHIKNL